MARYWAFRLRALDPWVVGQIPPPYRLVDIDGQAHAFSPSYSAWDEVPSDRPPHVVLLAIKWWRIADAARWIARHAPESLVISLMNGMGQEEALAGACLALGTTTAAAARQDDAVYVKSSGETFLPKTGHPREAELKILSQHGGWNWQWVDPSRMVELRWQKLLQNSVINPLTALADCRNGDLVGRPLFKLAAPLIAEGSRVAGADGVPVPQDMLARVERLAQETAGNWSSMVHDVRTGKPTEIQAINGYIVRHALAHGFHAPHHQALVSLIEALGSP